MDQATLASQQRADGLDEGAFLLADALYAAVATQVPVTVEDDVGYTAQIEETVETTATLGQDQSDSQAEAAVRQAVCLDTLGCIVSASAEAGRLRRRLQQTLYTSFRMYLYPLTGGTAAVGKSVGDMIKSALAAGDNTVTNSVKTILKSTVHVKLFSAEDASSVGAALSDTTAIEEAVNAAFCGGASCTTVTTKVFAPPPPTPPSPPDSDDDDGGGDDNRLTIILASTLGGTFVLCLCVGVAVWIYKDPQRLSRATRRERRYRPSMVANARSSSSFSTPRWGSTYKDDALASIVTQPVRAYTAR